MNEASGQLTPRQAKFVEAYALDRNAARAARSAGYSANGAKVTACRLLTNPNLRAALAAKEAELAVQLEIDREAVIGGILESIAAARAQGNPGQAIRGWVEIARIAGLDKHEAKDRVLDLPPSLVPAHG
ncbi:MAG: terminase small subunit [Rhodocyclaceae bacterium]|nr:terminase small subunit [Rhodocyclaceae bacterium]